MFENPTKRRSMILKTVADAYRSGLQELARQFVPPGQSVLELGCAEGDLLALLKPARGLGIDRDPGVVDLARQRHSEESLDFRYQDVEHMEIKETFDFIIMADLLVSVTDIQGLFEQLRDFSHPETRWLIFSKNAFWQGLLGLSERLGFKSGAGNDNWLGKGDVLNLLHLCDIEVEECRSAIFAPLGVTQAYVVRPKPKATPEKLSVTVLVPTRNEVGNVRDAVERIPEMGAGTEILFVDGNSQDGTQAEIEKLIEEFPDRNIRLLHQVDVDEPEDEDMARAQRLGKMLPQGKADAVRKGFRAASGEVLMICDADLTVAPEELPRFYEALASGKGGFINGCRLLYPMESGAMRYINLMGNKFFSLAFTWLLDNYVNDTLCGTKVFRKSDYDRIMGFTEEVGDFDPFGDFELLFGASAAGLRIVDLPIRYRARIHGQPKIENTRHAPLLFKMIWRGLLNLELLRGSSLRRSS